MIEYGFNFPHFFPFITEGAEDVCNVVVLFCVSCFTSPPSPLLEKRRGDGGEVFYCTIIFFLIFLINDTIYNVCEFIKGKEAS